MPTGQDNLKVFQMEAGQIDVDGSVEIVTGTSYTPPAPPAQEVNGTNQESREKDKSPSNMVHTLLGSS